MPVTQADLCLTPFRPISSRRLIKTKIFNNCSQNEAVIKDVLFFPDSNYLCKSLPICRRRNRCNFLHESHESSLLKMRDWLLETKYSLLICVYTFTSDDLFGWIKQLVVENRNMSIKIILNKPNPSTYARQEDDNDKTDELKKLRLELKTIGTNETTNSNRTKYNLMHHKFVIRDHDELMFGSFNWTKSAARFNHESVAIANDRWTTLQFFNEFEKLWKS